MFTIPSVWNIVISTIVFILAYVISWASGEVVDWSREKMYGPEPVSDTQKNLNEALEILKENGITPP